MQVNRGEAEETKKAGARGPGPGHRGKARSRLRLRPGGAGFLEDPPGWEGETRPRLAVLGDLYCVCNPVFNHDIEAAIERAGGEAVPALFNDISHFNCLNTIDKRLSAGDLGGAPRPRPSIS